MITPDVNVLVAASLADHPQCRQARLWLADALARCSSGGAMAILPMVAVGFVRVVTGRRAQAVGTPTAQAIAFLDSVLGTKGVWMPEAGPEWDLFELICVQQGLRGRIVSDAWIAAAVRTYGLHLVTFDADFRRLLRPDEITLLIPENKIQEPAARYFALAA